MKACNFLTACGVLFQRVGIKLESSTITPDQVQVAIFLVPTPNAWLSYPLWNENVLNVNIATKKNKTKFRANHLYLLFGDNNTLYYVYLWNKNDTLVIHLCLFWPFVTLGYAVDEYLPEELRHAPCHIQPGRLAWDNVSFWCCWVLLYTLLIFRIGVFACFFFLPNWCFCHSSIYTYSKPTSRI